jgi:penicillin V acylase-like amidase (Ntn superfamily)
MNHPQYATVATLALSLFASIGQACTVFTITTPTQTLFANNEDFNRLGAIWFVPASPGHFARVNVGFHDSYGTVGDFAQGSMNEKGLAFDAMVVADVRHSS